MGSTVGWKGEFFRGELLELRIEVFEGVFLDRLTAIRTAPMATRCPLSFGSHLIEYKLLITCQRLYIKLNSPINRLKSFIIHLFSIFFALFRHQ